MERRFIQVRVPSLLQHMNRLCHKDLNQDSASQYLNKNREEDTGEKEIHLLIWRRWTTCHLHLKKRKQFSLSLPTIIDVFPGQPIYSTTFLSVRTWCSPTELSSSARFSSSFSSCYWIVTTYEAVLFFVKGSSPPSRLLVLMKWAAVRNNGGVLIHKRFNELPIMVLSFSI